MKKRIFTLALALVMLLGCSGGAWAASPETPQGVLARFYEPQYTDRMMARMWFPDASAGLDENDTIDEQIRSLVEAGFGGVEVQFLADSSELTNDDLALYGWGSEAWVELLKKIYRAAEKYGAAIGGFQVDITMSAHWPPSYNSIDPNDTAAATEQSSTVTKLTASALAEGALTLALPETKLTDSRSTPFIFTDTFDSASLARVTAVKDGALTLDFASLTPLTDRVTAVETDGGDAYSAREIDGVLYAGSPAGVPDEALCERLGLSYAEVEAAFGTAPAADADLSGSYNGKQDENGSRARLADWQYVYQVSLDGLALEANDKAEIEPGDYVVVTTYYRGTGQVQSSGASRTMHNGSYVMNFLDESGIDVAQRFWEENILCDEELYGYLCTNGGSIFEDSIESAATGPYWTYDFVDEMAAWFGDDYEYLDCIAPLVAGNYSQKGTSGDYTFAFDVSDAETSALVTDILQDFDIVINELYLTQHIEKANQFANSFNYTYRAQCGGFGNSADSGAAALTVDVVESDVANKSMLTAVLMTDRSIYSKETMAGFSVYSYNIEDLMIEMNSNFSWGYNRLVLHGSAYSKGLHGAYGDWPGWPPFAASFGEPYSYRQIYFTDFGTLLGEYVARTQAVLQAAVPKYDIALLGGGSGMASSGSGEASGESSGVFTLSDLWSYGYNSSYFTQALLTSENAVVSNGLLYEDGAAYKALIVSNQSTLKEATMEKLIELAEGGLPILLIGCNVRNVQGTERDGNRAERVAELFARLTSGEYENVRVLSGASGVLEVLDEMGIQPGAAYDRVENLEVTTLADPAVEGDMYYYIFNNTTSNNMMPSSYSFKKYKTDDIVNQWITVSAQGTPYFLDALTGTVTQAAVYRDNGDGTMDILLDRLDGGEATILAVTRGGAGFPAADEYVTAVEGDADYAIVRSETGALTLRSAEEGDFRVTLSDGSVYEVHTDGAAALDLGQQEWQLRLESYGPAYDNASALFDPETGIQTVDPSESAVTSAELGAVALGSWQELTVSAEVLALFGVEAMDEVSGRGCYSTTFAWDGTAGAVLELSYYNDCVTAVEINGVRLTEISNATDKIDLGAYLTAGENTLVVETASSLNNRARVESDTMSALSVKDYGLSAAQLVGYDAVEIG